MVLRPVSAMRSAQVVACSFSLLAAGVLLARGFTGLVPSRPAFLLLGAGLGISAVLGLVIDHVEVRSRRLRPDHVLVDEVNRSRRFGHSLTLLCVTCPEAVSRRVVSRLRSTDWAWREKGKTYVLLVETRRAEAVVLVERIGDLVAVPSVGLASFPDDALTIDGLRRLVRTTASVPEARSDEAPQADDGNAAQGEVVRPPAPMPVMNGHVASTAAER